MRTIMAPSMVKVMENNMDNKKEYILCAAIKRIESKECTPYHNNDICNNGGC